LYYTIFSDKIQNKMKYQIITYGCQMNKSDSERIAAQLEKRSYQPTDQTEAADLVIINTCSIRQSAVNRVYSKVKQIRLANPRAKLVLTGCLLFKDRKQLRGQVDEIWPAADLEIKPKNQSPKEAWLPIMTGCNNFCSYCVVPYTRGREYSRPTLEIIEETKNLVKRGCQAITLLGQNVNSYISKRQTIDNQEYKKVDFPKLLELIDGLSGQFQIKFLTSHPKDMSDRLIKTIAQSNKIPKEIHLPVQSGDNQILKKMNRGYTIGYYKKLIKKIRRAMPQAQISTDIIVGFPGETEKQFQNTANLIKEIGFSQIYAAVYSPRPGTAAFKIKDDVPSKEKKRRKRIILDLIKLPKKFSANKKSV